MKYTTRGESQVENIVQGKAECCVCHETLTKCYIFDTNEAAVLYAVYCIFHLLTNSYTSLMIATQ